MDRPNKDLRFFSSTKSEDGSSKCTINLYICKDGMFTYTINEEQLDGSGVTQESIFKSYDGRFSVTAAEESGDRIELRAISGVKQGTIGSNRTQYDVELVNYEVVVEGGLKDPKCISPHEITKQKPLPLK
ncbi:pknB [Acrasis kona]|uniref:PknB n=1 Tax=Acrasis kona TaxID=1008807 RepID=A0AAW2YTR2_9EUKA